MRTRILHFQCIKDNLGIGNERAWQCVGGGFSHVIYRGNVDKRKITQSVICRQINTLNTKITVFILKHRLREIVTIINQTDNDPLTRISLGQIGTCAVYYFIGMGDNSGDIRLCVSFCGNIDEQYAINSGNFFQFR